MSAEYRAASDGPEGRKGAVFRAFILGFREAARARVLAEFPELARLVVGRARTAAEAQ